MNLMAGDSPAIFVPSDQTAQRAEFGLKFLATLTERDIEGVADIAPPHC
jgi:hypothetical protein